MRWIAGILLVCAAALKAMELLNGPTAAMVNPLGRYYVPVQIGAELGLGILVLSGLYWTILRWFLLILFVGFADYSFYLAINGATSCGCFGPLRVHPWWTFSLDVAVVIGLAVSLAYGRKEVGGNANDTKLGALHATRHQVVAVAMSVSVVATAALVRYVDGRSASADQPLATAGGLVILEPEHWIGERLPIAEFIDLELTSGEWIAVLHRHDCSACKEAVPRYEQLASVGHSVALIEVPPYGNFEQHESDCRYGRLKNDHDWFVRTPVEIHLIDGVVKAVKTHGH